MTYVISDQAVRKSVSHMKDCHNLVYRLSDDMRGRQCGQTHHRKEREHDGHEGHEEGEHGSKPGINYPASIANTVFLFDKEGGKYKVNLIDFMFRRPQFEIYFAKLVDEGHRQHRLLHCRVLRRGRQRPNHPHQRELPADECQVVQRRHFSLRIDHHRHQIPSKAKSVD